MKVMQMSTFDDQNQAKEKRCFKYFSDWDCVVSVSGK